MTGLQQKDEMAEILGLVCGTYRVSAERVLSPSRHANFVRPRHIAIYTFWSLQRYSQGEIANFMERDHATIGHAVEKIKHELTHAKNKKQLAAELATLLKKARQIIGDAWLVEPVIRANGFTHIERIPVYMLGHVLEREAQWLEEAGYTSPERFVLCLDLKGIMERVDKGELALGGSPRMHSILTGERHASRYVWVKYVPSAPAAEEPQRNGSAK